MITQERLKELYCYDSASGLFVRRINAGRRWKAGDIAGTKTPDGYIVIKIAGALYMAHRLAFLYITGSFPENYTDHINGVRHDNRWVNLRPVTCQENLKNTKKNSNNTSGAIGVIWDRDCKKWRSYIGVDGRLKHLGVFDNKDDAISERKSAEVKYNYHPNHGRD